MVKVSKTHRSLSVLSVLQFCSVQIQYSTRYTQARMLRKQPNFSRSVFLTFTIYFVSEQGNRFGAKVISLGYLGYLTFKPLIFLSFLKLSV